MYELPEIRWIVDRAAIVSAIVAFANAFDAKDWQKVRSHLAEEIDIDYSEFRGEPPRRVTAEEYIKQRVEGLAGLRSLHVSTNHEVTLNKNTAECKSVYQIYRLDPTRESGQNRLDTAGNYFHSLIQKTDRHWLITGIKQTVVIVSGNPQVHGSLRGTSPS
ncbi:MULTISPECIES: nuclear transport factor 2 family protein [unclassified Microcoleus]|uniref:nuclear transport factor 2 family protein n=1 Tax=unclassified Microcoleus TaxID=2642155 RepID=UPI002FD15CBB